MKISAEHIKKLNALILFFLDGTVETHFRYRRFFIPKKNGKEMREICCPIKNLKFVQSWINTNILQEYPFLPDCVHGFRKGHNIKTNAKVHLRQKYIYCMDIQDFFGSVTTTQVRTIFNFMSPPKVAELLTALCTYNSSLPQGAPTSPMLANIVFAPVDKDLSDICFNYGVKYTRYADDLTFSGNDRENLFKVVSFARKHIKHAGFTFNKKKDRLMSGKSAMLVTGLRLNSGWASIGHQRKKLLRAQIHNWLINGNNADENKIRGQLAYLKSIEPRTYRRFKKYMEKLKPVTVLA